MSVLASPTLSELIVEIRVLLNQQNPDNSTWTDQILARWLNEAIRRYFIHVVQIDEGYFTTSTTLSIVTGVDLIPLPTDFFQAKGLYKKVGSDWLMLPYRNNLTEGYSLQGGANANAYLPSYYFRGNDLVIRPVPNFSEADGLQLEYIQFPETVVNGGDTVTSQVAPIFRDLLIAYTAYKAKLQESTVTGVNTYSGLQEHASSLLAEM
jgi:hypothetical protein